MLSTADDRAGRAVARLGWVVNASGVVGSQPEAWRGVPRGPIGGNGQMRRGMGSPAERALQTRPVRRTTKHPPTKEAIEPLRLDPPDRRSNFAPATIISHAVRF